MIDKLFKTKLLALVEDAVVRTLRNAVEGNCEVWLTGEQVTEQFGMFTKGWLKENGWRLPRTRATVVDENGEEHRTGWAYPRNRIQRMIRDGEIERL